MTTPTPSNPTSDIFIVDTNILYLWLSARSGESSPEWAQSNPQGWKTLQRKQKRAASFCENRRRLFVVPTIVWIELYGSFLQKDIDLDDYLLWRRQRKAALQPLEILLFDPLSHFQLGTEPIDPELAIDLCRYEASAELQDSLRQFYSQRTLPNGRQASVKCLDGVDSAILAYAWQYAQRHPWRPVRILSDDSGLRLMIRELHRLRALYRRPVPLNLGYRSLWGQETPPFRDLVLSAFGSSHDSEARRLFNAGAYTEAATTWEQLARQLSDGRPYESCALLARTYAAWEQFCYDEALPRLTSLIERLEQSRQEPQSWPAGLDLSSLDLLQEQQGQLEILAEAARSGLVENPVEVEALKKTEQLYAVIAELQARALRRMQQKDLGLAALLFYRLVELLAQRRLALLGLDPSQADYSDLSLSATELLEKVNALRSEAGLDPLPSLPTQPGMLDGYILLQALDDPLAQKVHLRKLNGIMRVRNRTIYAHGLQFVTEKELQKMRRETEERLAGFWQAEGLDPNDISPLLQLHNLLTLPL